jgi:hypothetical protein
MKNPFESKSAVRLNVFSHPNHEFALFGMEQRLKPHFVYLTDGGGENRVQQTHKGLRSMGLLNQAHFLNHPEHVFYERLLEVDTEFFVGVAEQLRQIIDQLKPDIICCDAVEFYNPVHDVALPIVRAALRGYAGKPEVYEIPLVYQQPMNEGISYICQRIPESRAAHCQRLELKPEELTNKLKARQRIYTLLGEQMGATLQDLSCAHLGVEEVAVARMRVPQVAKDQVLRYEWRAEKLLRDGRITRVIQYKKNYLPVAAALFGE